MSSSKSATENNQMNYDDPAARVAFARHQINHNSGPRIPFPIWIRPVIQKVPNEEDISESSVPIINYSTEPVHQISEHKGINIAIEVSDIFVFDDPAKMKKALKGYYDFDDGIYTYSRSCNPTVLELGKYLAAMEDTESAYCTASGMAAITAVMMHLCSNGGHVVAAKTLYSGAHHLLETFLWNKLKVKTDFVDITNINEVDNYMKEGTTNVLYFEPLSNPTLVVANIPELCKKAHAKGVTVVVDNTLTPMIFSAANRKLDPESRADVIIHSLTKYVSGGADIMGGAICGSAELVGGMTNISKGELMMLGPTMNPKEAFELLERMSHMSIRIQKQCDRAMELAKRMREKFEKEEKNKPKEHRHCVIYPGLEEHDQHNLFKKMKNNDYGYGAMLCVDMKTTEKAFELVRNLVKQNFGFLAVSLGYYENLISCPGSVTKNPLISPGLVRISVGHIGTLDNKWKQFENAYDALKN